MSGKLLIGSVQRFGIEARRCPADFNEVGRDASNILGYSDNGDDCHFGFALGSDKRINH